MATPEAVALAQRQKEMQEEIASLDHYKAMNEQALRQALKKDDAVKRHTNKTSKEAQRVRLMFPHLPSRFCVGIL